MSNDLLNLTKQEIQKIQYDVLWTSIINNGYLPASQIEVLNKNLKTDSKVIIKAINEVLAKAEASQQAVSRFKDRFNHIIGDEISSEETAEHLAEIESNIINAIHDLKEGFREVISNTQQTETTVQGYENRINEINETLNQILNKYDFYVDIIIPQNNHFTLTEVPIIDNYLKFYVNGIKYPNNCFYIEEGTKNVVFVFTDSSAGGFNLDNNYEINVEYNYVHGS